MNFIIRKANTSDNSQILNLIKELAEFEKCLDEVETTEESMKNDDSLFNAFVAEFNNQIIGTAIYFPYYSTWKGKCIYLEDIVVSEQFRKKGIGKKLFDALVGEAKNFGAKRLMWQVLDWNEPAINFYKKLNASLDSEWINCKLTEQQMQSYKV